MKNTNKIFSLIAVDCLVAAITASNLRETPPPDFVTNISAILEQGFEDIMTAIKNLSDEDLQSEMPFYENKTITKQQVVLFAQDHCTNHRAKANLYVRMNCD